MNLGHETETVEFKKSTSELKEGVSSIASILNKHGHGELYFGVKPDGEVVGQEVSESTLRKVSQAIGNSITPPICPSIEAIEKEAGRSYIKVKFEGKERPYACNGKYRIRSADEDIPLSREQLEELFIEGRARKTPWDEWESERPLSDVNEKELESFIERGNKCGRISFEYSGVEDALERLGLLRGGRLTNAAEVVFCPSARVGLKMGVLASHARTEILDLHQEQGTLFQLVNKAELYILNNTRRRFIITGDGPREEVPEIPRSAVREILFNAFVHRDWVSLGCVQIDIFNDAVEVFSPGWFVEGQDPLSHLSGKSSSSLSRNMLIASTLYKSKDIESYGTGIPRVRDALNEAGIEFEYVRTPDGTKFVFHRNDAFEPSGQEDVRTGQDKVRISQDKSGLEDRVGSIWLELTDNERKALHLVSEKASVSSSDLADHLGITARSAARILSGLAGKDLLRSIGTTRNRTYTLK